ncbi:hypothetical protein B0J13DRAFT_489695 [Dactylonectria estremocensis]|uniref:DUF1665 domain-containing protein n=1 Tax=Dactylonectria estremocensis TaxID=1079267 RepID=A0A9P9D0M9_9HYPO|nr:hypothetical protein B0J13DRAFT_489695 [Dactylonectria estremocensis]
MDFRLRIKSLSSEQIADFLAWARACDKKPTFFDGINWLDKNFGLSVPAIEVLLLLADAFSVTANQLGCRKNSGVSGSLELPGFGLPLAHMPAKQDRFPILIGDPEQDWAAATLLIREVCMLRLVEEITNKPEWWKKIREPNIATKWKDEALDIDWASYVRHGDFTTAMADSCINEIRKKADIYEQAGLVPVLDYSACIIKSDRLITEELRHELIAAVEALENVPEEEKDWHPGSNKQVLNLVHPSLCPLVYGRSRILLDKRIGVQDCLDYCGLGQAIPMPDCSELIKETTTGPRTNAVRIWGLHLPPPDRSVPFLSPKFQWLPCDVVLDNDGGVKIDSYINNLHPIKHTQLYPLIERFIAKALPAWDLAYRWPTEFRVQRLSTDDAQYVCQAQDICTSSDWGCSQSNRPLGDGEPPRLQHEEDDPDYERSERAELDNAWFNKTHPVPVPEPDEASAAHGRSRSGSRYYRLPASSTFNLSANHIKERGFFNGASRIQVIVKLANIQLTPDKPYYRGGSWHVEGQLNEHICATALFYYDNDNITESRLAFRTSANAEDLRMGLRYDQNDYYSIERTFAIRPRTPDDNIQEIGSILTREGRAIIFPNLYQHRVRPFGLADRSRPGHRKILALFLVDPAIPIISTANVPPQQRHWWLGEQHIMSSSLPRELNEMILDSADFPIDETEAKSLRDELMAERTVLQGDLDGKLREVGWNFCEH